MQQSNKDRNNSTWKWTAEVVQQKQLSLCDTPMF
jgi:hypothetical protein